MDHDRRSVSSGSRCIQHLLPAAIAGAACLAPAIGGEAPSMDLTITVAPGLVGSLDQPMIAVWLEDSKGTFIRTLHVFSKAQKWYKDMTAWYPRSKPLETKADVDAVVGATIIWGSVEHLKLPTTIGKINLLSGQYVLRWESIKDHSKHYIDFAIPLKKGFAGGTFQHKGYVRQVEIAMNPPKGTVASGPKGAKKP
jgi:hypothetical protein